jgi:cytochrome c biogenesis protein CcmG, thiol:disulfide interchange protein DsbE
MITRSRFAAGILAGALMLPVAARAEVKTGEKSPDFSAKTFNGGDLKLSSLRGKVVLLDFWASWCEPCKKELPLLSKMAPRLKSKGIEIVAVNIDEDKAKAEDFLRTHALSLTVVSDQGKSIVGRWEPPKMPSSFAIDKNGVVRAVNGGFEPGDESKLEAQLTQLATK